MLPIAQEKVSPISKIAQGLQKMLYRVPLHKRTGINVRHIILLTICEKDNVLILINFLLLLVASLSLFLLVQKQALRLFVGLTVQLRYYLRYYYCY